MNRFLNYLLSLNSNILVMLSFLLLIGFGTLLLMLPQASESGEGMYFVDALFTATSASCVTGLVVADTSGHFSLFGEIVLIILIQLGGLGLMTITTLLSIGMGRRLDFRSKTLMRDFLNQHALSDVTRLVKNLVLYTLVLEFSCGSLLAAYFYLQMGTAKAVYYGYWHAVSAFCNAGFDLFGNYSSLTDYRGDLLVNLVVMFLIIMGGIGFSVIDELSRGWHWKRFSLHTKLVLAVNGTLLGAGTLLFWALEAHNPETIGSLGTGEQLLASMFQSVSSRTAGFNTVDIGAVGSSTMLVLVVLMFIGASPTSTGGGIKTTTMAILFLSVLAQLRGKKDAEVFNRHIDPGQIGKAHSIFILAVFWLALAMFMLLVFDGGEHSFRLLLFELVSAFGTVGLGVGITPELNIWCKIVLTLTMFIGRIGILTFSMSFFQRTYGRVRYPSEKILIG